MNTELSNPIGLPQPVSESMFRTCRACLLQISLFTKESTPLGVAIKEIYLATNNLGVAYCDGPCWLVPKLSEIESGPSRLF